MGEKHIIPIRVCDEARVSDRVERDSDIVIWWSLRPSEIHSPQRAAGMFDVEWLTHGHR